MIKMEGGVRCPLCKILFETEFEFKNHSDYKILSRIPIKKIFFKKKVTQMDLLRKRLESL